MELVVDANIFFSALIKEGTTRELLLSNEFVLYAPEFLLDEFLEHVSELESKTHVEKEILKEKIKELIYQSDIRVISRDKIKPFIDKAIRVSPDPDDFIYFAAALKLNCSIWSNDKKLKRQDVVKIYSTRDLASMF